MMNKIIFKLFLIFIFSCSLSGHALAFYKHKVIVTEFDDPKGWKENYSPGKILSKNLKQKLMHSGIFHMLPDKVIGNSIPGKMSGSSMMDMPPEGMMKEVDKIPSGNTMMYDPVPWPVRLGSMPKKASLFEIRGQVVKFDPGNKAVSMMDKGKTGNTEEAELEIMLQFIQNKTGRVVYKQKFRSFSNSGKRAFSKDIDLGLDGKNSLVSSSMSLAFSFVTNEMLSFVNNTITKGPLEGEIIALKNEDVLINIGRQNGVQVGDRFRVHSVGLKLDDPLTEHDLGDIYVKMGVIQVLESMMGFSKATIIVGKDFMPGNLVRSVKQLKGGSKQFSAGETFFESEDPVPWWSFHGIKSVP